jgi:PKD repeat protein
MAVYPQPKAIFVADPQNGCNPLEVSLNAQKNGYQNYDWLVYGVPENSGQTANITFDRSGVYPLQLAVRHFNCVDTSNAVEINVYPVPEVAISFNPEEIYGGNTPVEFFVKNYDATATYTWFINDKEVSKERRFTTSLGDTGFHQVRVEIRSQDGCLNEAMVEVYVFPEAFIIFPNAFYPGTRNFTKNEAFRPVTYGIADWEIEVFAPRMGQKLFEGKNQAWDGGKHPQGTYMFIARYTTLSGEKGEMSGTVHLLR